MLVNQIQFDLSINYELCIQIRRILSLEKTVKNNKRLNIYWMILSNILNIIEYIEYIESILNDCYTLQLVTAEWLQTVQIVSLINLMFPFNY